MNQLPSKRTFLISLKPDAWYQKQQLTFRFFCEERTGQELSPVASRPKKTSPLLDSTKAVSEDSLIVLLPEISMETSKGRTWGLPSRSCFTSSSPSRLSPSSPAKWSSEKSRCLRAWSWVKTKSDRTGDMSSRCSLCAIRVLMVFLHCRSALRSDTVLQEISRVSNWGREQISSRISSFRSVLTRWIVLSPWRERKARDTPPSSSRYPQFRVKPLRANFCRLALQSGLEARPEMTSAPVRPPRTQEASNSRSRWGQSARRKASAHTLQRRMEALRRRSCSQLRKIPTVVSFSIPRGERSTGRCCRQKTPQFSPSNVCGIYFSCIFNLEFHNLLVNCKQKPSDYELR